MKNIKKLMIVPLLLFSIISNLNIKAIDSNMIIDDIAYEEEIIKNKKYMIELDEEKIVNIKKGYAYNLGALYYLDRELIDKFKALTDMYIEFDNGLKLNYTQDDTSPSGDYIESIFIFNDLTVGFIDNNSGEIDYVLEDEIPSSYTSAKIYFSYPAKPALSGKDSIVVNIDNKKTIEEIKSIINLKAYDDYDKDLTSKIKVINDTYTSATAPGKYQITFSVTNSSNLTTNYILNVFLKDLTKPVIFGPSEKTISYTEEFDINTILSQYTISDNIDTDLSIVVDSNNYVKNKVGTYTYNLSATDSSKNKSITTLNIIVIDDVDPIFVDENQSKITVNWKDNITNDKLLLGLTATDEVDGDVTSKIKVVENNLTNKLGEYVVKYEVLDSSNNKALYERIYKVISTDLPNFFVSSSVLYIEDIEKMTNEQLAEIIASYENIEYTSFSILTNSYENNENKAGVYEMKLSFKKSDGTEQEVLKKINVFSSTVDDDNESDENFFIKVYNAIKNFFIKVWNAIVKIFTALYDFLKNLINSILKIFN